MEKEIPSRSTTMFGRSTGARSERHPGAYTSASLTADAPQPGSRPGQGDRSKQAQREVSPRQHAAKHKRRRPCEAELGPCCERVPVRKQSASLAYVGKDEHP